MVRTRIVAVAAAAALALSLGACSDDDGGGSSASDAEKPYVEAATANILDDEDAPFEESEAECIATLMVQTIGVDRLEEAGVTPEDIGGEDSSMDDFDFTDEDVEALTGGLPDCIDVVDLFVEGMAASGDPSDELLDCIRDNVSEEDVTALLASEIAGEEPDESFVMDLIDACPALLEM